MKKKEEKREHKINEEINSKNIRVVDFGERSGIYSLSEALSLSKRDGVDLVEISCKDDQSICKIIDYSKFRYDLKKKEKNKNCKTGQIKEIKFGPNTGDHDFEFKKKNIEKFLEKGFRVKALVHFKGREKIYKDKGEIILLKLIQDLQNIVKVEQMPTMVGDKMFVLIGRK